jgi:glycosyltransferase involved in cell wall biosynthesis
MRLAILTQYYPPEIGAPQARLSELAQKMVQAGHAVTVLTAMPNYPTGKIYPGYGGLLRQEHHAQPEVIRTFIYPTQKANFIPRLANYFSFVISSTIAGSILLRRPDYLMVESPPLFLGLAAYWLSRLKRTRLIFNVSDLWPESAVRLGMLRQGGLSYRLSAWLERFCYRKAWLVTGQSKSILSNIQERFPSCHTFHLSNGVDTGKFHPERQTPEARAILDGQASTGSCIALYAGLHGLAQGLDQIVHAAELMRADSGFRFVLVGDGPEKQMLIQQARQCRLDNIRFLDPRPSSEIPALVASADIILVTLKTYIPGAVPSKLYEAMASGRPVVLVAGGEPADIVQECRAGVVVDPGDIEGLAQALRMLNAQPALRRELGENGRKAAEQYFDRTKIVARFVNHLEVNL